MKKCAVIVTSKLFQNFAMTSKFVDNLVSHTAVIYKNNIILE